MKKSVHLQRKDGLGRMPDDHYQTDLSSIRSCLWFVQMVMTGQPGVILDPGAGSGRWGDVARECWPDSRIEGVEIRDVDFIPWGSYDDWYQGDFLTFDGDGRWFDLVVGNPPYRDAETFIRKAHRLLSPYGTVAFLLRLAFLEGQKRRDGLFREYPPRHVGVLSKRPSFQDDGRTNNVAFAFFVWQPSASWISQPLVHFLPTLKGET